MRERSYSSAFLDVINCNKISIIYWDERETMAQPTTVFHGTTPYEKYVFNILYSMRIDDFTAITSRLRQCILTMEAVDVFETFYLSTKTHGITTQKIVIWSSSINVYFFFCKTEVSHKEYFVNVRTPLSSNYTPTCTIQSTISCMTTMTVLRK
jgi:hypothetical protein